MRKENFIAIVVAVACLVGFSSCDKEEAAPVVIPTDLYFEAEMNGKTLLLPEGKDGYLSSAVATEQAYSSGCIEKQGMRISKGQNLVKSLEVIFLKRLDNCTSDCSKAKDMVRVSSYTFGNSSSDSDAFVEGVVIKYTDVDGKVWSTDQGTADQSGSSFQVVEHKQNNMDAKSEMITKAEFSCVLYDTDGNELLLDNGKIVSRSIKCN